MYQRSDIIYLYDGSFEGFLSCVFESFLCKQRPYDIVSEDSSEPSLMAQQWIETDMQRAQRVRNGIGKKISEEALYLVTNGFCTCHPQRELLLLDFIHLGFERGKKVCELITDPTVHALQKAVLFLKRESHLYLEFVRFSEYDKGLVSVIEPKNRVLPTIAPHFCDRLHNELFIIYDKTHRSVLIHKPPKWAIVDLEDFIEPQADETEQFYRELWGTYFDAIAIRERINPRCQMTHMPKRYWKHMTEMQRRPAAKTAASARTESTVNPVPLPERMLSE
ncbi:TIGR03915 family putative DNA repair protein [Oscillospiraceae bacterium LTW-04]|nr:TIGR03915 family putative DNA repair protein [Oscillospiraceae bacterium MB24-C1]